jgi:hypothetical protein
MEGIENKDMAFIKIKAYLAVWLIGAIVAYMLFAFISWEWKMANWFWSIRLIHVIIATYISYSYGEVLEDILKEDKEENNFFNEAPRYYND